MSKHAWQNFLVPESNQKLCFSVGIGVRHLLFTTILSVDVFSLAVKGRWEFVTLSSLVSLCDIWLTTSGELRFRCGLSLRIQGDLTGNKGSENFLCIFAMLFAEGKWEWQCERHIPETRERTRKGALEVTFSFPWLSEPFVSKRASKLNPSSPKTFPAFSTFDFSLWVSLDCPLCPGNSRVKNSFLRFVCLIDIQAYSSYSWSFHLTFLFAPRLKIVRFRVTLDFKAIALRVQQTIPSFVKLLQIRDSLGSLSENIFKRYVRFSGKPLAGFCQ